MSGRYRIGGLTVEVAGEAGALKALARAWAPFAVEGKAAAAAAVDATVVLQVDPARPAASTPAIMPEVHLGADGSIQIEGASFHAEIDRERRSASVRGADERFGVESAIKHLVAARLAKVNGLLIHGAALAQEGRAALFTGPSRAGKSTLGKLGQQAGLTLLADELVAVWPATAGAGDPGYRAAGTPWNEGAPAEAALVGVGTLHWADSPRIERQPPSDLLRVLMGNVLLADPSPEGRSAALRAQAAFVSGVQTWRLYYARDPGVGDVIRRALMGPAIR